jgi:hypothetical protein
MASRLFSTKYQLKVEQVRMRMRLKKTTNFVRRLTNLEAAEPGEKVGTRGGCGMGLSTSELISLINDAVEFFRDCDAQESRGLEIDGNL